MTAHPNRIDQVAAEAPASSDRRGRRLDSVRVAFRRGSIEIRGIETLAEYQACERLQTEAWGTGDFVQVSPLVLITAQHNGGVVLGAFDGERLVGFVCSFVGLTEEGEIKHCSQLLAVAPDTQFGGIGFQLKLGQREAVLAQGVDLITWTFDPLASVNAHFNLCKLGCTASRYVENLYGEPVSGLNGGLATDRLIAEWRLRDGDTEARLAGSRSQDAMRGTAVNRLVTDAAGLPSNTEVRLDLSDPELLVEIPPDLTELKGLDLSCARVWRQEVRSMLGTYLARGYRAVGFYRRVEGGRPCAVYRLIREVVRDAD